MPAPTTPATAPIKPTPPAPPRLFLVDGYALIYRAFFALLSRPLTTVRGENTSAAWGVVNFLQRLLTKHQPEYLGWVHDSGLSFRHELYPEYKATREKLTEELQSDFDTGLARIAQILEAYGVPVLALPGYEADDVIGTLARAGVEAGTNVIIVSGDKDFQQLVRSGIWLLNPGRGGPASVDEQWVGVENGGERLGVAPHLVTDYLAMVGDTSDNVPGVPGIGDKTARELVEAYGDLESILSHAEQITKKRPREALLENAGRARMSKELVTIRTDLPIALELEKLRIKQPDTAQLRQLFLELEFTSLLKDLDVPTPLPVDQREATRYVIVDTVPALETLVRKARSAGSITLDTETVPEPGAPTKADALRSRLVSISIALRPGEAYYLPFAHREYLPAQGELQMASPADGTDNGSDGGADVPNADAAPDERVAPKRKPRKPSPGENDSIAARMLATGRRVPANLPPLDAPALAPFRALLEDAAISKTAHNAKYDILVLRHAGVTVRGLEFDTMLASYVLDPGRRSHDLDMLALEFLGHSMISYDALCGKGRTEIPFDQIPVEAARDYSCEDADIVLRLHQVFAPQLVQNGLVELFREVEVPLVDVLAEMEFTGISIDESGFASLKERFRRERERVEQEIYVEAGETFNINSNPQLRAILFEKLQLPIRKKTATGPSTDASVLQEMADEGHVLPSLLMEYRELSKLESTYLDTLPQLLHPNDKRLHTSFNQTVAATGRLSSSDPNLQNIPIRRELGRDIRRGFIPRAGWKLVAADYSQIELRLLAHLSRDPSFVEAFISGGDIHRQTAAIIFDVPLDLVSSEMRARAKTINFATIYGQGANALSRQLKIPFAEAKEFIATYFERFKGVRDYLDSMVAYGREHGYVETIFHRRRYVPELKERNFNIRAFGERVATNAPIQGSAADLIKMAMIRIDASIRESGMVSRMLLQVHDELVFESPADEIPLLTTLVRAEMEQAAVLSVPLVVDIGLGNDWLETKFH